MASQRIAAAIRGWTSPAKAFADTPGADAGSLWISAPDLMGRQPYGTTGVRLGRADAAMTAIVAELAGLIESLAQAEAPRPATINLVHAAGVYEMLQDPQGALRALSRLPDEGREGLALSHDLLRLIGGDAALPLCGDDGSCRETMQFRLAEALPEAGSHAQAFMRAFVSAQE